MSDVMKAQKVVSNSKNTYKTLFLGVNMAVAGIFIA
jgi:hypothetical protein